MYVATGSKFALVPFASVTSNAIVCLPGSGVKNSEPL